MLYRICQTFNNTRAEQIDAKEKLLLEKVKVAEFELNFENINRKVWNHLRSVLITLFLQTRFWKPKIFEALIRKHFTESENINEDVADSIYNDIYANYHQL